MALYTITLNDIIKNNISLSLNNYPIFDESYRDTLNQKIIDRYRFYEIGQETIEIFNHELSTRMNEIMPVFNKKYQAQEIQFNKEYATSTKNEQRDGTLNTDSVSNSSTLFSDTPNLNKLDDRSNLALTNVSEDETTVDSDSTSSDTATITESKYISVDDIIKYHDYNYFNNIDVQIIDSLIDLFHMLYSI